MPEPMNTETEYPNFSFWKTLWGYFQPWRWHLLGAILLNLIVGLAITIETAIPIEEKVSQEFSEKAEQLGRRAFSLSMTNIICRHLRRYRFLGSRPVAYAGVPPEPEPCSKPRF